MTDLKSITAILFDVDGVLTDGGIILDAQGEEIKNFNVRDGQLVAFMQGKGIVFGAISGRDSRAARKRMEEMKVDFFRFGQKSKEIAYAEFKKEFKRKDSEILYIGDDVIDIPVLALAGVAVAPADASFYVVPHVHMQTKAVGGRGVLREVIDAIIQQQEWNEWSAPRKRIGFTKG